MSYSFRLIVSLLLSLIPAVFTSFVVSKLLIGLIYSGSSAGLEAIGLVPAILVSVVLFIFIYSIIIFKIMRRFDQNKQSQMPLLVKIVVSVILIALVSYILLLFKFGYPVRLTF